MIVYALDRVGGRHQTSRRGNIESSPTIGRDGKLYVGSMDHKLYALDLEKGTKAWEFTLQGSVKSSPTIGADGTVYVGARDDYTFYGLNARDGKSNWSFTTSDDIESSAALSTDGTLYVGSRDSFLYAVASASPGLDSNGGGGNNQHSLIKLGTLVITNHPQSNDNRGTEASFSGATGENLTYQWFRVKPNRGATNSPFRISDAQRTTQAPIAYKYRIPLACRQ